MPRDVILQRAGLEIERLRPLAPPWRNKATVAEFVKARPVRIVPVYDLNVPLYPEQETRVGRPKASPELSVMPDAERAYTEIKWFLTEIYYGEGIRPNRQRKNEINDRSFEFAAAQFEMEPETLRKYCIRSGGERQRLWPRPRLPKIT
jgi:hypothetical protein